MQIFIQNLQFFNNSKLKFQSLDPIMEFMTTQYSVPCMLMYLKLQVLSLVSSFSLDLFFGSALLGSVTHGRETKFKQITSKFSTLPMYHIGEYCSI
jgi:hypothetical protein